MNADEMASLAAQGPYWWMRSDGSFYATSEYDDTNTDVYLLAALPNWVDQWASWDDAAAALAPQFALLSSYRNP